MQICVIAKGFYQLEVTVFGYNNPTGRCPDCVAYFNNQPGCCDEFNRLSNCDGNDLCDSFFVYCLRQPIGKTGRGCSYFSNRIISDSNTNDGHLNFSQSPILGLENPIVLWGLTGASIYMVINTTIISSLCAHI